MRIVLFFHFLILALPANAQEIWYGLVVEDENRCSPYDKKSQYPYPQSVEDEIVASMGDKVYGPYTGRYFASDTETDIEHIVSTSEGHDSGLCSSSSEKRKRFATDLLNLTLAAPEVNRCRHRGKCGLDPAEWLPEKNQCWFADRVVQVKRKYGLSVDTKEAGALYAVLSSCNTLELVYYPENGEGRVEDSYTFNVDALSRYDDNDNGRISCAEARFHGITPVHKGHPAYNYMRDSDGDGVVCE